MSDQVLDQLPSVLVGAFTPKVAEVTCCSLDNSELVPLLAVLVHVHWQPLAGLDVPVAVMTLPAPSHESML